MNYSGHQKKKRKEETENWVSTSEDNIPEVVEAKDKAKRSMLLYGEASFDRMLPSSFDGMKPIHRRIIYSAWLNNLYKFTRVISLQVL
jgi:DNA gyrase/topoisomerase IV subunit A